MANENRMNSIREILVEKELHNRRLAEQFGKSDLTL